MKLTTKTLLYSLLSLFLFGAISSCKKELPIKSNDPTFDLEKFEKT